MSTKKIALLRRLPPALMQPLERLGALLLPAGDVVADEAEAAALLQDADAALVTALDRVSAQALAQASRLKLVCNIGVGYDNIDIAAAHARGITVTNTPGAMDDAVADLVFGLMLGLARRLPQADAFVRGGHWSLDAESFPMGLDVSRKVLGIIGFGRIGRTIARRALGFDMEVLYSDQSPGDAAADAALKVTQVTLDELLARADFVVVQVAYGPATHHLIGAAQLARMKRSAVLINAARGGVVNDAALAAALQAGSLAGAALDCVEGEPAVHPALLEAPHLLLTPHIGSATPSTRMNIAVLALKNLTIGLQGRVPPNVVAR